MNYSMKKNVASGESNPAALKRAATALAILHGVSRRMQKTLLSIINEVSIYEKGRAATPSVIPALLNMKRNRRRAVCVYRANLSMKSGRSRPS